MKTVIFRFGFLVLVLGLLGCEGASHSEPAAPNVGHADADREEPLKGPHGGRLLRDAGFALELAIFEAGVPPEFRVWATDKGEPVSPGAVNLQIILTRLGGVKDTINFIPQNDFLRGDTVIYEPHSFVVSIEVGYAGTSHRWEYENFEGRTSIDAEVADSFGLETDVAGPGVIREVVATYGRIVPSSSHVREIGARFEGLIKSVAVSVGDTVAQGQVLATIESNASLTPYTVTAPIDGIITAQLANPGEQTAGRQLFTLLNPRTVWAELAVFPSDRARVKVGDPVTIQASGGDSSHTGKVDRIAAIASTNQSVAARVVLDNVDGTLVPGLNVTGNIEVAEHEVPLAVMRSGLQGFRNFTVVYAKIGDEYEVRMLELGRQDRESVEVLGGLEAGTRYVTTNSYLVKADIEKSGASHDH